MFGRDMDNVKAYCEKIGAKFVDHTINDFRQIYVYDKDAYELREKHPLLFSHFFATRYTEVN